MSETSVSIPAATTSSAPAGSVDNIVDSIDFDFDLGGGDQPAEKPKTTPLSIDADDFDDDDGEETAEKPKAAAPVAKEEPKAEAKPKELPEVLPKDRGTEDKPYTVKDLPEDKFIKVKIDGKETTVTMRDLADGYIRRQTFDSALSTVNAHAQKAETIATRALKLQEDVVGFVKSPDRMFAYFLEHEPEVMVELGRKIGTQLKEWMENPQARHEHEYTRKERKIAAERQRLAAERQQWEQQRTQTAAAEAAQKTLAPMYQEAMKKAGFPKVTPEFTDTVKALYAQAKVRYQGKVTQEIFESIIVRAAKVVGTETVETRTPQAPAAPAARAERSERTNGKPKKDWSSMTWEQKVRDPDFFLSK